MATLTLPLETTLPADTPLPALITDPDELEPIAQDAASMQGSGATGLLVPRDEHELARWLQEHPDAPVLAQGALTSLTGGATPDGDVVVSLKRMTGLHVNEARDRVTAGAGLLLANLQEHLADLDLYYPPAPTHDGASIGGNVSTNAAGAATFKYGTTRDWVERIRMVLRNGDRLELRRGQHAIEPADVLRLEGSRTIELPLPGYRSPALKKSSVGYFVRAPLDPIDLLIGSEGTLGIITEVELGLVPRPRVATGLCYLSDTTRAIELTAELRKRSLKTRGDGSHDGLDVRSIEYFDRRCLELLRAGGALSSHQMDVPADAQACLLFEQEIAPELSEEAIVEQLTAALEQPGGPLSPIGDLMSVLADFDLVERTELALPGQARRHQQLAAVREAIPLAISDYLRDTKRTHPEVHKVGGDMIVPFEHFEQMLGHYQEVFRDRDVDMAVFGHISDGNVHPNALPRDAADMARAKEALVELAGKARALGGCPMSEHGVGKHPLKQQLLAEFWGAEAIAEMRAVKSAFDPSWTLARGVFFPPPQKA